MAALERYTVFSSSEFAVRPFIISHEARMMEQMSAWARHANEHVRRLASEGCRPRLPWGQALPRFQKDPSPVLSLIHICFWKRTNSTAAFWILMRKSIPWLIRTIFK